MASRIRSTLERYPWLTCEEAGRVLGYAYATVFRSRPAYQWAVDVSAYVRPEVQRGGVANALYTSLPLCLEFCKLLPEVWAASVALMESRP